MGYPSFTLDRGKVGKSYSVRGFFRLGALDDSRWEMSRRRLEALGVVKGEKVTLISKLTPKGPFIILSMGSKIGISKTLLSSIQVEEIPDS